MLPTPLAHPKAGIADLHSLFQGFADPIRIRILNLLAAGELCVCDIGDILKLPQSTVSRHLAYLRRAGVVEAERAGKFTRYRLAEPRNAVHRDLQNCVRSCFVGIVRLDSERALATRRVVMRAVESC
ncbi:MAG TPA: metalloregulator ArsR/SmtB family transcription factor [Gemmatimonadales bacterium]|nr:metalloregulator ArsR/SmtB family transcription factor [Gemmatimonadales bacterium]